MFVSKLAYGPRVWGWHLPGYATPRRGDVAVFHYPPGLEARVEDRVPYVKRIVAQPGDTVAVEAKRVVVNGTRETMPLLGRRYWQARTDGPPPPAEVLARAGLGRIRPERLAQGLWLVDARADEAARLAGVPGIEAVEPYLRPPGDGTAAFPISERYSLDFFGPIVVPRRGLTVPLSDANVGLYRLVITRDEGHTLERSAEGILIDGRPAEHYTFSGDYLFVLGDHRDDSADSRTWGFVPVRNLIGRASWLYLSWDAEARAVRWNRIGRIVR